mmetsp:Transcript_12438/g.19157  ORF Transcript_12438/g.19157 Transcript_12438/m.19157 type:complete len:226 (-) Transcript_12438:403-1080(-)
MNPVVLVLSFVVGPGCQGIIEYKIIGRIPSLVQIPIQRAGIGIFIHDQIVIVVRLVINIVAVTIQGLGGHLGRRQGIGNPSLVQTPQKVPFGKDTTFHLKIPKEPSLRHTSLESFVGHHLGLTKVCQKVDAFPTQGAIQKGCFSVLRNVLHYHGRECRGQLIVGTTPFSHHAFHAYRSRNGIVRMILVTTTFNVLRVVSTDVGNVLSWSKGTSFFKKDVVGMTIE